MKKKNDSPVYFVGAGPGDVELITVKGWRLIQQADRIIYAGSLINTRLLAGSNAELIDSSDLYLEQIIDLIVDAVEKGMKVVRLHTGDPSVFGAIREQMVMLEKMNIRCKMIPGVSSAFGAAASLGVELTLPEVSQTVIITRIEGRTPVPEKEKLHKLARHQATMMIFLSVSMIEKVVTELIEGGYRKETPVAVVEKATWPDEKIIRGNLSNISQKVRCEGIRKTAMICVGDCIAENSLVAQSKLYDKNFSHGERSRS